MIGYLIKNNFKLMFRSPWSMVIMVLSPILVIMVLSSAFAELMKSYEGVDAFAVGYRVAQESAVAAEMDAVREAAEEAGITFYEYPEGEPGDVMANNALAAFVEFTGEEYVLYKSADYEVEGITLEYFLSRMMSQVVASSLEKMNVSGEMQAEPELPMQELDYMPSVSAGDYYGIIYIVYFASFGMICAAGVLGNEKKYGIEQKFRVSHLSEVQLYMGRLVPITMVVAVGIGISAICTVLLYDIHWGKPLLSALIILTIILAGNSFGMMLYNISKSLVITIIILFTSVWFMGFFGGSFETYMYSSIPDTIKQLSPIYHSNRALVELSCMGQSAYVGSAIMYCLAITVVCSVIAVLAATIRKRGRA